MRRRLAASFALALMVSGSALAISKPEDIAASVFLGQAYPSGNIYLRPVPLPNPNQSEDEYLKMFSWPDSVSFQSLGSTHAFATRLRNASFSSVLHDSRIDLGANTFQLESAYIPGLESMDASHEGCTKRFYKAVNPSFQYLSGDFFYSVLFNCNPNEGIGVFKSGSLEKYSFSVVAFSDKLRLTDVAYFGGHKRPMTNEESALLKKEKEEAKARQSECTTVPTYLDSAILLFSGKLAGSDLSIRLSNYETPGCGGHLASIYLLDIIKGKQVLKTYSVIQYLGAI